MTTFKMALIAAPLALVCENWQLDKASGMDWNAWMESFCMHARNLNRFLVNDAGKGNNNLIARDCGTFDRRVPPSLTGAFQRLNRHVAHLAKTRSTDPAEKFTINDARKVATWVDTTMAEWLQSLDPEDRKRWAISLKKAPRAIIEQNQQQVFLHSPMPLQSSTSVFQEMTLMIGFPTDR